MKLHGLKSLVGDMKSKDLTYTILTYSKNKIDFDVFLDIGVQPYRLLFVQLFSELHFEYQVLNGYEVNPILNRETYSKLCSVLNLKYDPIHPFNPALFLSEFNQKIPLNTLPWEEDRKVVLAPYILQNTEQIEEGYLYCGKIDWDKLNNGKNRRIENLYKVRYIFPALYEIIKHKNISIKFTNDKRLAKSIENDFGI